MAEGRMLGWVEFDGRDCSGLKVNELNSRLLRRGLS